MRRASPSTIAVLPTPGSPISITELARSRWQRISSTCWISLSRPNTGGSLSWRASRLRLVAKCFRNGGSSKRFFSRSSRSSMSRIRAFSRDDEHFRLDAVAPQDRHRHALRFLEHGREQVGGFDRLAAGAAGVVQRELEDELGRRRDAQLAAGERRHHVQVLLDRLKDGVRVQLDVPHHLGEHVPFDLREREEDMFVGEQRVLAPARFFDRAVDDALRGFANLAWRDVEIVYVHRLPSVCTNGKSSKLRTPVSCSDSWLFRPTVADAD